jgi:hypothetical protein
LDDTNDKSSLVSFLSLSSALTGVDLAYDLGTAFFAAARRKLEPKLSALLSRYDAVCAKSEALPSDSDIKALLNDAEVGPVARQILLLWYVGGFETPEQNWEVETADHFYRALVWEAIGAHAPTNSNGYFGHWRYPPEM